MTRWLSVLFLAVLVGGCTYQPTDAETHTVSELTTRMATHGLGRYLIDLPSSWRYGSGEVTLYYGLGSDFKTVQVEIIDREVTPAQFQAAIEWRVQRLRAVVNSETNTSMLAGAWPPDVSVDGDSDRHAILLRYYRRTNGSSSETHELHWLSKGAYVRIKADSFDNSPGPVEERLRTLAKQIFLVDDPARAGPGFILGPIVIRGAQDHEVANIKFYDPARRDLTLEINSSAVTPDEERRLLQRSQASVPLFRQGGANLHSLRSGKRAFAGMEGEEDMLSSDSTQDDGSNLHGLLFSAETYRADPGLTRPTLTVQFQAGGYLSWNSDAEEKARREAPDYLMTEGYLPEFAAKPYKSSRSPMPPVTSSLSDYEATQVWDAVLPAIRLRPGAVSPPRPKDEPASRISPEQVEADRLALDDFIASLPDVKPSTPPR